MVQKQKNLRARSRRTLLGGGGLATELSVGCPTAGDVPLQRCARCEHFSEFRLGSDASDLSVVCTPEGGDDAPRREALAGARSGAADATVAEIMATNVVCVSGDVRFDTVSALLLDLGISGVPVVDDEGRPIGIVSKTDLLRVTRARDDAENHDGSAGDLSRVAVEDVMMPIAFCVPENESIARAAALMAFEGVHRVPVVGTRGQVVGLVSPLDILGWLARSHGWVVGASHARQ